MTTLRGLVVMVVLGGVGCRARAPEVTLVEFADFVPEAHDTEELDEACLAPHLPACLEVISRGMDDSDSVTAVQLARAFTIACDVGDGPSCFWFARAIEEDVLEGPIAPEDAHFVYGMGCLKGYQPACTRRDELLDRLGEEPGASR